MTRPWFSLLCLIGLGAISFTSYAQETTTYSRPQAPIPDPVYVLNSSVIINGLLQNIDPQQIKSIEVYKGPSDSETQVGAFHLKNVSRSGVVNITASTHVRSRSFTQVGRQLGLQGPLVFALNGHTLSAQDVAALRIAPAAIGQLHIQKPTPETPETRVDIWLAASPKAVHPPGTIMVR